MAKRYKSLARVTLTSAGTRQRVSSSAVFSPSIVIQADHTNSGYTYIGDESVSSTVGLALAAGDTVTLTGESGKSGGGLELNLNDIWFDAQASGNKIRIAYLTVKT